MAYLIGTNNQFYRIAADDTAKSNLNIIESNYDIVTISDTDFNKIRLQTAKVEYSNGTYNVVDIENNFPKSEEILKNVINSDLLYFENWLIGNEKHSNATTIKNYCNFLKNFDTSSISYPMTQTFGQYLIANSIEYISPLQS